MLIAGSEFDLKTAYFNTPYLGPTPRRSQQSVLKVLNRGMDPGATDLQAWFSCDGEVRLRMARLVGCHAENIALSSSVSELVSHVANGIDIKSDEEVLLLDGDYPSMILPWLLLAQQKGFKVRLLDLSTFLEPSRLKKELGAKTRLVGCSHVMFNTGTRLPVAELAQAAREVDALFISDTSQSLGGMCITSDILNSVDILVGVTYKWILGPYGSAYGYFSNRALARVRRTHASWLNSPTARAHSSLLSYTTDCLPGARRFDRGEAPAFIQCAGLEGALDLLLELGLDRIEKYNMGLVNMFFEHLPAHFEVASSTEFRSNIVSIKPARQDVDHLRISLSQKGFDVAVREGYIRLGFHFFNTAEQVQGLLEVLS